MNHLKQIVAKLEEYGLADRLDGMNRALVALSRRAAGGRAGGCL